MAMIVDPDAAAAQAAQLHQAQQAWEAELRGNLPLIPLAALGQGLVASGKAAAFQALVSEAHAVRTAHARRLAQAGQAATNLVRTVDEADISNAISLTSTRGRS
ncbi:MAG TPA: hypothetical protein H9867_08580 [Candidatus Corynebacterium gallistercoris]|uniref:Uncharacterized protein n=1 Tax=Candidatus Corynebacterium gallistercoris TaxID=2838530 RepID=A0A9D1RZQ8_9CORY|nr:hypothetical protein [Candidatus Corynebacterium gallistercoris]